MASEGYATVEFGIINDRFCIDLHEPAVPSPALEPIRMPQPSGKLFVPDQALYWLDGRAKPEKSDHPSNPVNKRDWLQTHNLPEFDEETKDTEKTPWTRIDRIEARTEFLKNLGSAGDGFALPGLRKENLELLPLTAWIEYGQPSGEHRSPDGARIFW